MNASFNEGNPRYTQDHYYANDPLSSSHVNMDTVGLSRKFSAVAHRLTEKQKPFTTESFIRRPHHWGRLLCCIAVIYFIIKIIIERFLARIYYTHHAYHYYSYGYHTDDYLYHNHFYTISSLVHGCFSIIMFILLFVIGIILWKRERHADDMVSNLFNAAASPNEEAILLRAIDQMTDDEKTQLDHALERISMEIDYEENNQYK